MAVEIGLNFVPLKKQWKPETKSEKVTWVRRPNSVREYKREVGSSHPVRQRARSDIAAIYKKIYYGIQKLLKPVNVTEWKSTRYEQPQAGTESDYSEKWVESKSGEVNGNNVD